MIVYDVTRAVDGRRYIGATEGSSLKIVISELRECRISGGLGAGLCA